MGKVIEADFKEEVKEKKINVIACYKYFWDTKEFEQWQRDTKDTVINIAQITSTHTDNGMFGICVLYTVEDK